MNGSVMKSLHSSLIA